MVTETLADVKIVYIDRVEEAFDAVFIDVTALHVKITFQDTSTGPGLNREGLPPVQYIFPWCNILKLIVMPIGERA